MTQTSTSTSVPLLTDDMNYKHIIVEHKDSVALITLNRPEVLNALCHDLMIELGDALNILDYHDETRVVVLTGSPKAFAAGADISEMVKKNFVDMYSQNFMVDTARQISNFRKPLIAAVSGYALGGGCELAMICDFILGSESAKFGQPEIKIGAIPGIGGSQRLTRLIGKAKAMDMILTGRVIGAEEAEKSGLISRILPNDTFLDDVLEIAQEMSKKSMPTLMMAKEAVNRALETTLQEGLIFESRLFQAGFSTEDQKEGMTAFLEKREPKFQDK